MKPYLEKTVAAEPYLAICLKALIVRLDVLKIWLKVLKLRMPLEMRFLFPVAFYWTSQIDNIFLLSISFIGKLILILRRRMKKFLTLLTSLRIPIPEKSLVFVRFEISNERASFFIDWLLTISFIIRLTFSSIPARLTSHLASICAPADCCAAFN